MKPPIYNRVEGRPEGSKVIALSNDPLPGPTVATLVRFEPLGRAGTFAPVIRTDEGPEGPKEFITLGLILPYSEELLTMIQAVGGPLAFKTLCRVGWFRSDIDRHEAWIQAECKAKEAEATESPKTKLVNAGFDHPGLQVFQEVPLTHWDKFCHWVKRIF